MQEQELESDRIAVLNQYDQNQSGRNNREYLLTCEHTEKKGVPLKQDTPNVVNCNYALMMHSMGQIATQREPPSTLTHSSHLSASMT